MLVVFNVDNYYISVYLIKYHSLYINITELKTILINNEDVKHIRLNWFDQNICQFSWNKKIKVNSIYMIW